MRTPNTKKENKNNLPPSRVRNAKCVMDLGFRVHTVNLLGDVIVNLSPSKSIGVIKTPLNQFQGWLATLATRATELNDPELNVICLSLGLYEIDPLEIPSVIESQLKLVHDNKGK